MHLGNSALHSSLPEFLARPDSGNANLVETGSPDRKLVQPFRFFALFVFLASRAFVAAQDERVPFGMAFAPTFTFSETYRQGVIYSAAEEDFLDQTTSTLSGTVRVSMQGLNPGAITNESRLFLVVGNLSLDLILSDGSRSVVGGMNVVRWRLEGTDPDTGDPISDACTVTLRYDSTELIVQVTSSNAPDDFNIIAPDEAGTEGRLDGESISFDFFVGPYFLDQRPCYVSGTSAFYNTTVNGELFEDLATVNLTGEIDSEKPVVKITEPKADAAVDTSTIEVSGTVTDNYAAVAVEVSLNAGPFVEATLADDQTWRLAGLSPTAGINSLVARAEDESGNVDLSAVRTFVYTPRSQLTVTAEGNAPGSVSGDFVATLDYIPTQPAKAVHADLLIGKQFTLIATPGAEALFDHWSSNTPLTAAQAASPRLEFTMTENLTLTAHFVINPFVSVRGRYIGLLTSANSANTGFLSGKVTLQGGLSLKAKLGALTLPIKGRFSTDGHFIRQIVVGGIVYTIDLTLNVTGAGARTITGTIVSGNTSVTLTADLSPFQKKANPAPAELVGTFNFLLPPRPGVTDANYPIGIGFGRLTISSSGTAKFTGKLADGTPVSAGTLLSGERRWPVFGSLYGGGGSISGWVSLDPSQVDYDLSGILDWKKPWTATNTIHREGFVGQSELAGARSDAFTLLLALSGANPPNHLTLLAPDNDPIPLNISLPITLRRGVRTTVVAPPGSPVRSITCKVQPKTGLLSGKMVESGAVRKIQGVVVGSKLNRAGGFILRNGYSTALSIIPAAAE